MSSRLGILDYTLFSSAQASSAKFLYPSKYGQLRERDLLKLRNRWG
jgi:hypothetical protein